MAKFCTECGAALNGAKYCPNCGAPDKDYQGQNSNQQAQSPQVTEQTQPTQTQQPKKKGHGGFIALSIVGAVVLSLVLVGGLLTFIASVVPVSSDNSSNKSLSSDTASEEEVPLIFDAAQIAGLSEAELRELVGELSIDGDIELIDTNGTTLTGQVYYTENYKYNFVLLNDKVVSMQYWSDKDVPFEDERDIFKMFGITPDKAVSKDADTGSALRYSAVSDTISDFWVQIMDKREKTFTTVKITYDSQFAGRFANEPPKPDLEVLETSSTSDGYVSYITGKIKNNSDKTYSYVQVSINVYDGNEVLLGSTLANVNNLEPGAVWEFKAPNLYQGAKKFKITDVTGF